MKQQMSKRAPHSLRQGALLTSICAFLSVGCGQLQTRSDRAQSQRDDFAGTPNSVTSQNRGEAPSAPLADAVVEKKVAVLLGPGGYKAFAHAGVIKELRKQSVPIHGIIGVEWGALVAGLYAQRSQFNEVEWKLYKLEKMGLNNTSFFGTKPKTQSIEILKDFLRENLDLKDLGRAATPFACPSLMLSTGVLRWQDRGPMSIAVQNCLAAPPLLTPEGDLVAGLMAVKEAALRLKKEGYNVILLVNVLGEGNLFDKSTAKDDYPNTVLWNEVRRSLWEAKSIVTDVIDVDTREISFTDLDSRKQIATAGEVAGDKAAKQLTTKYGF